MTARVRIAVTADLPDLQHQAEQLARELGLPLACESTFSDFPFLLVITPVRLELRQQGPAVPGPVYVDFLSGPLAHRRRFGGGRNQALAKAIGLRRTALPLRVLDATPGLGRDAFVLACLGCHVHMVERSTIVAALLRHGLRQAAADPEVGPILRDHLRLSVADSRMLMERLQENERPEVIYLDPMYPPRNGSALVKKEMRALREIVGEDKDAPVLLATALECACKRVVVKRPKVAPSLEGPSPSAQIATPNTRFDIYGITALPARSNWVDRHSTGNATR